MKARSSSGALSHPGSFPLGSSLKLPGADQLEEQVDSVHFQSSFLMVFISDPITSAEAVNNSRLQSELSGMREFCH